jgi:hypothetical protein
MENSQITNFRSELTSTQVLTPDLSGDYLWKSLYSHSYTLFFNCENCSHQFDIDGWFYQFDSVECPQCKTIFTGVFGKIIPGSKIDTERTQKGILKLESFDNQEIQIHLSSTASIFNAGRDHIVLVVFSKSKERNTRPWCWVDWSNKNTIAQYFQPQLSTNPINRGKVSVKKSKSIVPFILLGLVSIIGICSLFLVMTPGFQLFK